MSPLAHQDSPFQAAERLGLQEQQIQRYEATDYASASLTRIKEVVSALGIATNKPAITTGS